MVCISLCVKDYEKVAARSGILDYLLSTEPDDDTNWRELRLINRCGERSEVKSLELSLMVAPKLSFDHQRVAEPGSVHGVEASDLARVAKSSMGRFDETITPSLVHLSHTVF